MWIITSLITSLSRIAICCCSSQSFRIDLEELNISPSWICVKAII